MDIALDLFDQYAGDAIYASLPSSYLSSLARDSILRQALSLYLLTYIGILFLYFSMATASYYLIFDHRMKLHPRYLPNQVSLEIASSLRAFPWIDIMTLPWFLGDVRGWSLLYDNVDDSPIGGGIKGWVWLGISSAIFLGFTDYCIYWLHRWLHVPWIYKRLHKPHHKWIIPTPFASHAFHPVDGYLQSVPYHVICYLLPIHKYLFIGLFSFVNLWSIFIHDSDMISNTGLEHYINGPAHHTLHHIHFTVNYGQYFVWSDKTFGSFRLPAAIDDPLLAVLAAIEAKKLIAEKVDNRRTKMSERSGSTTTEGSSTEASGSDSATSSSSESDVEIEEVSIEQKKNL